jgi:uncharacterized Rossmann fold enzyme
MNRILLLLTFVVVSPLYLLAQTRTVQGVVFDKANNTPLSGVTVQAVGSAVSTATDTKGSFTIAVASKAVLTFSYIGFATQQVQTDTAGDNIQVWLSNADKSLDAVVVTALGFSKQ